MSAPAADTSRDRPGAAWVVRDVVATTDAAACLEIYAPYVRETCVSFEEVVPTVDEFRARIAATTLSHPWLVLEDAGRVVGYAYASTHRTRAAYRWAADVTVYIAVSHHRLGVGRRLYVELFEKLRRQGFRILCAGIALPNEASVGLHQAMGFEPVGVYKRIGWKLGAWHDVAWFEMELVPAGDSAPPDPSPTR